MDTVRFGFIGAGEIGNASQKAIAAGEGVAISAVYDVVREVADDIAGQHGAVRCASPEELLAREDVEAVYVCTPHYLHAPYTIQAAQAGKHVLCEKPIATTVADADAMIGACREAGVKLGIAFSAQVSPATRQLSEWLARGLLGRLYGTYLCALGNKPPSYWHGGYTGRVQTDWRPHWRTAGGGMLIMNLIHNLNTIRFVTGLECEQVYAAMGTYATEGIEVEDYLVATLHYDNGARGSLEVASNLPGGAEGGDRVYGTNGQLRFGREPKLMLREIPDGFGQAEGMKVGEWCPIAGDRGSRTAIFEQFAQAVRDDTEPPVSGLDGRQALAIVEAAYTSARTGQPQATA